MDKELMKGSIDILILSVISRQDTYGYAIIQQIKRNSDDDYSMSEGTLYPALKRLEGKGYLQSYWGESDEGGRRKFYRIMEHGQTVLEHKLQEWKTITKLIGTVTGEWHEAAGTVC